MAHCVVSVRLVAAALLTVVVAGCSSALPIGSAGQAPEHAGQQHEESDGVDSFLYCTETELTQFEEADGQGWRRSGSRVVANSGPNVHRAFDAVVRPDGDGQLRAKFAYSLPSWDLEEENIEVWVDDCSGEYRHLGTEKTDEDGIVELDVGPDLGLSAGAYSVVFQAVGDGSYARSMLRVLPKGTTFVVFDIDDTVSAEGIRGTVWDFLGLRDEKPRAGASETSRIRRFQQGYQVLYLSSRHEILVDHSRKWLTNEEFAPGTLAHAPSVGYVPQSDERAGGFKRRYLEQLRDSGYEIAYAYGNAGSDLYAYRGAGLEPHRIFMFGEGFEDVVVLSEDFQAHNDEIRGEPPVQQPFRYRGDGG